MTTFPTGAPSSNLLSVEQALENQSVQCGEMGSLLYAGLLRGLLGDYRRDGLTARLFEGSDGRPVSDALALRYLATAHRLALAGRAPELAQHYPSCGGEWDGSDITPQLLDVVRANFEDFELGLQRQVQTNEVGRAPAIISGLAHIAERFQLPLRLLEIGSSAGLLSRLDSYYYDNGSTQFGNRDSELVFPDSWWSRAGQSLDVGLRIEERAASDLSPVDASTAEGRLTMASFIWPDQGARFDRLRAALNIAAITPLPIQQSDAGAWLTSQLSGGPKQGAVTVVFHAIVWQYLPAATQTTVRNAIEQAGMHAWAEAPMAWLQLEPATNSTAALRLTTWPGGTQTVLADVGYHGANIHWH